MESSSQTRPNQSFASVIDTADALALYRRMRRRSIAMRIVTTLLLVAGICVAGFPVVLQWRSAQQLAYTASDTERHVAGWPYPNAENAFSQAQQYNRELADSEQPVLGEGADPFAALSGGSKARREDSAAAKDKRYQSLLDSGNGVMGTIRIPKISVTLPIYHGTSEESLASGAGHLYGTSLPVGGRSTHSVITGHRGLVSAPMFTRLDEMKQGDFFYIEVMNEMLGYEVDSISVIDPNDTSKLRIRPNEDRVTLMTCTPYGINTQRLLVSGHRVNIPVPAPDPDNVRDARTIALLAAGIVAACGWLCVGMIRRLSDAPRLAARHVAIWPRSAHRQQ